MANGILFSFQRSSQVLKTNYQVPGYRNSPEQISLAYNGFFARSNSEIGQCCSSSKIPQVVTPSKSPLDRRRPDLLKTSRVETRHAASNSVPGETAWEQTRGSGETL